MTTSSAGSPRAGGWRSATSATPRRPPARTRSSTVSATPCRATGPAGVADGSIELHGRDSVTINSGGEKIFAEEVELAVKAHPGVYDCVVAGRPSERWGSEVVAIVHRREGADVTPDSLLAVAADHIARYKLPKGIVFVDEIVRSPVGQGRLPLGDARSPPRRLIHSLTADAGELEPRHVAGRRREARRGARHVRRHRPAVRPRQPHHDVPARRPLAATSRPGARPRRRRAPSLDLASGTGDLCVDLAPGGIPARVGGPQPGHAARRPQRGPASPGGHPPPARAPRLGRWGDVRVRPAQPRRPGIVLRGARPGRATRRSHRPARRRHPQQPSRALGQRHLLRHGCAADRRSALRPGRLPLPPAQRRLPPGARGHGGDARRRRIRRRHAHRAQRRHHPTPHRDPADRAP